MKVRRQSKTNTGERYIIYRKSINKYRVIVDRKEYKSCDTLEQAIKKRDEILRGITNGEIVNKWW